MSEFMRAEPGIKKELRHLALLDLNSWILEPASVRDLMYISFVQLVHVTQRFIQQLCGKDLLVHLLNLRLHLLKRNY
jgi:hypothetical protein